MVTGPLGADEIELLYTSWLDEETTDELLLEVVTGADGEAVELEFETPLTGEDVDPVEAG